MDEAMITRKPHFLDLITSIDAQGNRCLSLTECSAFLLIIIPLGMGLHSYITNHKWDYLPEFCFYAWGCAAGIKATKGGVGAVNSYYSARQYPNNNNQGGRTY